MKFSFRKISWAKNLTGLEFLDQNSGIYLRKKSLKNPEINVSFSGLC
jgi:hypothetical protein